MATIYTHPGGPYYQWRVLAVGVPPPAVFDTGWPEGILYAAWQAGQPREAAALAWGLAMTRAGYEGEVPVSLRPQPVAAPAPPIPGVVQTNPGGPYYVWRQQTMGSPPPATFNPDTDCEGKLYHGWQQGLPQFDAKLQYDLCVAAQAGQVTGFGELPPVQPTPPTPPQEFIGLATDASYPTVYGVRYDATNLAIARTLLNEGLKVHAPRIVLQAIIYAATGESDVSPEVNNGGPLQTTCNMSAYNGGSDWAAQAHGWYTGGECFASGGGLHYAGIYSQAWQIAGAVEENAVWAASHGDSYQRSGYTTAMLTAETANTVAYLLPGLGTSGLPSAPPVTSPPQVPPFLSSQDPFSPVNWAGDFINAYKDMVGGADEAAHMADLFLTQRINAITAIGWT